MNTGKTKYFSLFEDNVGYLFALLTIIYGVVVAAIAVPFNIDSIFDEGFHYLFLYDALHGTINGVSQWANMLAAILPGKICTSVLSLRIIGVCLPILTACVFICITQKIAISLKEKIIYIIMVFFLILPSIGGIMICYNEISQFLLITACAIVYRLCTDTNQYGKIVWSSLTGFLLSLALFSILPSAAILGVCIILLVAVRYWKKWRELLMYLASGIIGFGVALLCVHLFVANISDIISSMIETAQTITTVSRGYDPISFILKICLFIRDFAFCSFMIVGVYVLSQIVSKWSQLVGVIVFVGSILLYSHYQVKPNVTIAMIMALMWIIPIINHKKEKQGLSIKNILNFRTLFSLFLLCFPVLASIGTNVYIGGKMSYFLVPWALLLWQLDFVRSESLPRNSGLIVLSILLFFSSYSTYKTIDYSQHKIKSGGFKDLYMNSAQEKHFTTVDSIASLYCFKRNESVVFATQLSMVTLSYLEGVPCGVFFQPTDFVRHASNVQDHTPDFIFLCKYDEAIAGETLQKMNWGWPEEFDEYDIGTPETIDVGYPTERWLYCRSKLKKRE